MLRRTARQLLARLRAAIGAEFRSGEREQLLARLDALERSVGPHAAELERIVERLDEPERRTADLQSVIVRHAAELQRTLGRLDEMERHIARFDTQDRRATVIESSMKFEQRRIDWALCRLENVDAQTQAYHAYRETEQYQAAYMAAEPLVSVSICTMDRADLLMERSLPSLLSQSYRNLQIIVIGDNCIDDTAQRLAALRDSRVHFVNLPERGPYPPPGIDRWCVAGANAGNLALSLFEGEFITHLDDDDRMVPHRIETMLAAARENRADFLWHAFWYEHPDGSWARLGSGRLEHGQVTNGSIFYHRYFARIPWDLYSYRIGEPGDWNRLRKIRMMRARQHYVDEPLLYHHVEHAQRPFVARDGERFLD
ncbi:MAG: hypothetical protein QOF14_4340 [Hyphomicrobiales bacterium]|jgi:hypothetical protein|nr:hypothetical protein [Hyphomicrobiales bacterium]